MIDENGREQTLDKHVSYSVLEILKHISNVETILLCGSYGRGEGAWVQNSSGQYIPYNDYDFIVVSDNPGISKDELNSLRKKIAQVVQIKWVDIDIYNKKRIKKLRPTQKNIDITFGSRLVYGKKINWNLTETDLGKLGRFDIETVYFTRLWTFWGSFPLLFDVPLEKDNVMFFRYQMAKAVLACVDVILIRDKKYHFSYKERIKRIKEQRDYCEWFDLFDWAMKEKTLPGFEVMSKSEAISLFYRVVECYYKCMKIGLGKEFWFYEKKYRFEVFYLVKIRHMLLSIYHFIKRKGLWDLKYKQIMIMQNNLFMDIYHEYFFDFKYYSHKLFKYFGIEVSKKSLLTIVDAVATARNEL